MTIRYGLLVLRAFCELARYEIINSLFGFKVVHRWMSRQRVKSAAPSPGRVREVCDAVTLAACFYWKPVLCLQRSVATASLLRKCGIPGQLVIGYRPSPFFSHAWVEVDGNGVNDLPGYKKRLQVLCTA